jgi:hypothetical protein
MTFTIEDLKELEQAHRIFDGACYHDRLNTAPRWLTERVVNIYENRTGNTLKHSYNCSICVLNIYRTIGKLYFEDLMELNNTEAQKKTEKKKKKNTKNKQDE